MDFSLFINIVLFVGAAQGLLLALVVFSLRRENKTANILLGTFLLLFSLIIFSHAINEFNQGIEPYVPEDQSFHVLFFFFGPLIYLYVKALTDPGFRINIRESLHLLPFIIFISLYGLLDLLATPRNVIDIFTGILVSLVTIQFSIYLYLCHIILKGHKILIRKSFSSIEKINLDWLHFIITAQLIIWPIGIFIEIFYHSYNAWNLVWVLVSVFIYMMGYKGIRQPEIFTGGLKEQTDEKVEGKKKYEKSTLTAESAELYFNKLVKLMETEKLYFDSNITLPFLANKLMMSNHHLSQIINERLGQNFFEFINSYRIEEAKRLLADPEKQILNISAIAFESGFNTLSSFNSVFKKFTGLTPSEYKKAN